MRVYLYTYAYVCVYLFISTSLMPFAGDYHWAAKWPHACQRCGRRLAHRGHLVQPWRSLAHPTARGLTTDVVPPSSKQSTTFDKPTSYGMLWVSDVTTPSCAWYFWFSWSQVGLNIPKLWRKAQRVLICPPGSTYPGILMVLRHLFFETVYTVTIFIVPKDHTPGKWHAKIACPTLPLWSSVSLPKEPSLQLVQDGIGIFGFGWFDFN